MSVSENWWGISAGCFAYRSAMTASRMAVRAVNHDARRGGFHATTRHNRRVKRIVLIRHAKAHGHEESDPALDSIGEQQAVAVAQRLASGGVDRVLSSPKRRAVQTATAIARLVGCACEPTSLLDDRTPVPSSDRRDDYPADRWEWLDETPPEERDENAGRLIAAWTELTRSAEADSEVGTLVLITHAFVIASFVSRVLSAPPSAWMQLPVSNASVTELQLRKGRDIAVVGFNDVSHLG